MGTPRTIRQRLGLLAAIYGVAVLVNFVISAALIVRYLRPALMQAQREVAVQQQIERVQALIRRQDRLIQELSAPGGIRDRHISVQAEISSQSRALEKALNFGETADLWLEIEQTTARKERLVEERIAESDETQGSGIDAVASEGVLAELGQLWQRAGQNITKRRTQSVAEATRMQRRVLLGLVITTAACLAICVAGTLLIKRWMVEPLGELEKATAQFSHGNLAYQIPPLPKDEIGQLGHELTEMARKIAELELRRLNRIRFETASTKVRELDDLIRGPLKEIRRLAVNALEVCTADAELVASHRTTLETLSQLKRWLARLQESTSASEPCFQTFAPAQLATDVRAAMQTILQRHQVQIEIDVDPCLAEVEADRAQAEYALLSLVSNAVEASQPGKTVRVLAQPALEDVCQWDLCVVDQGTGIPSEVRDRIGRPFFTTKPEGTGFGLLIVNAVARAHGGRLLIESREGEGSRFTLRLPRRQS